MRLKDMQGTWDFKKNLALSYIDCQKFNTFYSDLVEVLIFYYRKSQESIFSGL